MNKFFKIVLGILATIVLGAIGSGLWERMLGPFLDWLTHATVGFYASAFSTYRDSIYANAAKGFHEEHSLVVRTLVITMLPLFYYYLLTRHPTEIRDPNNPFRVFMRSRRGYWLIMFLMIAIAFGTIFTSLRIRHINETSTFSLASIEIVRPFVGEQRYTDLRSRYFAMRKTEDFHFIYEEVVAVAKEHRRQLPDYEPL